MKAVLRYLILLLAACALAGVIYLVVEKNPSLLAVNGARPGHAGFAANPGARPAFRGEGFPGGRGEGHDAINGALGWLGVGRSLLVIAAVTLGVAALQAIAGLVKSLRRDGGRTAGAA